MQVLYESVAELLATLLYAAGAGLLTVAGLLSEQNGIHELLAGHSIMGMWFAYVGTVLLVAGVYALGYKQVLPRLRRMTAS